MKGKATRLCYLRYGQTDGRKGAPKRLIDAAAPHHVHPHDERPNGARSTSPAAAAAETDDAALVAVGLWTNSAAAAVHHDDLAAAERPPATT